MSKKRRRDEIDFDESKIRFYYGIPHCHSIYSTGKGTPTDLFEYAAKLGLHFLFITDHNNYLANTTTYKDSTLTKWQATLNSSIKIRKNSDDFLPMVGFECKTSPFGEFNIINSKSFFTGAINDLRLLMLWMMNNPNSFISINHPHKNILLLPYDPYYNKMITSIEVTNGNPSSKITHHEKYYFLLLDRGWQLGAINGQDNHRINFSESENLTVYIGNDLSRESLVSAFRAHRTYSTESRFLKLYFTINDIFMGGSIKIIDKKLKFMINVEDIRYKIKSIQIISKGGKTIKSIDNINLNSIKYLYEHSYSHDESWYVIKVTEENDKVALSSPIFINKNS